MNLKAQNMTRDFIISEMQRVAVDLGRAPGRREFLNASGIKESDWMGRFWARWGDALEAAGLKPNELQTSFSDEHLLESLARLTRDLGKFPTNPEMRLARRTDSTFPNDKTFRRFGNREGLVSRLLQFCRSRSEYDDVSALCPVATSTDEAALEGRTKPNDVFGFVYLLKSGRFHKIGRSNAAGRRERELAIQLPDKAQNVHVIATDDPIGIEKYWHDRFASRRKNGEWFELTADDLKAFKRRKFM